MKTSRIITLAILAVLVSHQLVAQQGAVIIRDSTTATQASVKAAGTATPNVVGVQGNVGGVPVPVSGVVSIGTGGVGVVQLAAGTANVGYITGSAVTLAAGTATIGQLTANQSVNVAQINGVTPLMGNGLTGTGSARVTVASDNTPFNVILAAGTANVGYVTGSSVQLSVGTATIGALTANQSVNVAQVNGITTLTGNGLTGTGSQRVTVASDNTPFNVILAAGTANLGYITGSSVQLSAGTATIGALTANQSINLAQVNGVAPTAAAALSDALANPTAQHVGAYTLGWNGAASEWERIRGDDTGGLNIQGPRGVNGPVTGNPLLLGASDGSLIRNVAADSAGRLTIVGAATSGTAKSGFPVQIGGVFNTTVPTLTTGQVGEQQLSARASILAIDGIDAVDPCASNGVATSTVSVALSTTGVTEIVAASGSTTVYVCGFAITTSGTTTPSFQFQRGTGDKCATGNANLTGAFGGGAQAATGQTVTSPGGFTQFKGNASDAVCIAPGGTAPSLQGYVTYKQK